MDKKSIAKKMGQHSDTRPVTRADHKLSVRHLAQRIKFNEHHIKDHKALMNHGGSKKYNKDHIGHHKGQIKEDEKLIKERAKSIKKAHG